MPPYEPRRTPAPALPPGERLPEYDDDPQVDAYAIQAFLRRNAPGKWGTGSLGGATPGEALHTSDEVGDHALAVYERELITDVIGALLAVGDATIVKNATYRAMVRDGREIERLAAGMSPLGLAGHLVRCDGNPVTAALATLEAARDVADMWARAGAEAVLLAEQTEGGDRG